jgi:hypothetical protein
VLIVAVFTIVDVSNPWVAGGVATVCATLGLAAGRVVSRYADRRRAGL